MIRKVLEGRLKPHETLGAGPLGDPIGAIKFALTIEDHFDMRAFLADWLHGDLTEWPEFVAGEEKARAQ